VFSVAAGAVQAQSARVAGTAGYLAEWEFSGDLSQTNAAFGNEFSGPLTWKHVGLCSPNGPEEKFGDIDLKISRSSPVPQILATLRLDGVQCNYRAALSKNSTGRMDCSDAKGVPLTLSFDNR
jgi:hypothetical protein